jgi:hypothetical protein
LPQRYCGGGACTACIGLEAGEGKVPEGGQSTRTATSLLLLAHYHLVNHNAVRAFPVQFIATQIQRYTKVPTYGIRSLGKMSQNWFRLSLGTAQSQS